HIAEDTPERVDRAAGREGKDHPHLLMWIAGQRTRLRVRGGCDQQHQQHGAQKPCHVLILPDMGPPPFQAFVQSLRPQGPLRQAITSAYRRPEPQCLPPLIEAATLPAGTTAEATALARRLVERLRAKGHGGGVEGLIHEYALSSQEGVALMCLAEALLRIPDDETRDALIRDKIGGGDWEAHLGH